MELRDSFAWIVWHADWKWNEKQQNWKLNKIPSDRTNGYARAMNEVATRSNFDAALEAVQKLRESKGTHFGIGVTFCAGESYYCLDLDGDLINGTSERLNWLTQHYPTWAEKSVSGTGMHLFYRGQADGKQKFPWRGTDIEIFGSTGFIAVTGNCPDSAPPSLSDGTRLLSQILAEKAQERETRTTSGQTDGTDKVSRGCAKKLNQMFASKNGPEIRKLWEGGGPQDTSSGDLSLCNHLAFWLGPCESVIDQAFRDSRRMRGKWDERHSSDGSTYGQMTISKALMCRTEFFKGKTNASALATPDGSTGQSEKSSGSTRPEPQWGFEFERLSDLKAKPVKWLVPGRIPCGKVTLLAADGGSGKSTLTRHLGARVTRGKPAFGMNYPDYTPGNVLLCAAEDSFEEVVIPHLVAEDADLERVARVFHVHSEPDGKVFKMHFGLEHIEELKVELAKHPDVKLIVIDPIASFVGRCRIDDHKQSELRRVLDPLSGLAEATGVAVIVVAHLNKTQNERAVHRIAGSIGYAAAVRLAYMIANDPEDEERRFLLPVKKNLLGVESKAAAFRLEKLEGTEAQVFRNLHAFADLSDCDFREVVTQMARVRFEADVEADADEVFGRKTDKDPNKVARCAEWLKVFLAEFAYPADEILEAANRAEFTLDNLKRAKAILKQSAGLFHSNNGKFQGKWWAGLGHPRFWKVRPQATSQPLSPPSPSPESPLSQQSPPSPHTGSREEDPHSGERVETTLDGEKGDCFHPPATKSTVSDPGPGRG